MRGKCQKIKKEDEFGGFSLSVPGLESFLLDFHFPDYGYYGRP